MNKYAFTLVELLVVVAIIALLLAILLPSLNKAREAGRSVACASVMRQIGLSSSLYGNDFNSALPTTPEFMYLVSISNKYGQAPWDLYALTIMDSNGYFSVKAPRRYLCPSYLSQNTEKWGFTADDVTRGLRAERCYYLMGVYSDPSGKIPNKTDIQKFPEAMYHTSKLNRPSARIMMDEYHAGLPTQLPHLNFGAGGQYGAIGFDGNPGGIELPVGYSGAQWYGRNAHVNTANWLFYDGHIEQLSYPALRARTETWDFNY